MYVAEAHPTDEWQSLSNVQEGVLLAQHQTLEDRITAARLGAERLRLTLPIVVDTMDDATSIAYSAWPERIYIIGADGRIAYKGGPGPWGFDPAEAAEALDHLLAPVPG